ncbi:MAG: hypothetical protein JXB62_17140 [Pirellulales bacterium]|nr:hypothetical protein [Pirellulales bacterium]
MYEDSLKDRRILEIMLVVVCAGLACLLHVMPGYSLVVLNLFFLPVVLAGFFLGRYLAGVTALFCVISASCVLAMRLGELPGPAATLVAALEVTVWAAVLGLTTLLIGTLSDEHGRQAKELHDAYVGVVEVLAHYLQSSQPLFKARSVQVAELSQRVGMAMKLSPKEIDDIRVASLLYDMENVEITTRVIRRAMSTAQAHVPNSQASTFQGADLVVSLGAVLNGAVPLLLSQDNCPPEPVVAGESPVLFEVPLGAEIIRAVRAYCELADGSLGIARFAPAEVVQELGRRQANELDPQVLEVLKRIVSPVAGGSDPPAAPPAPSPEAATTPVEVGMT